MKLFYEKSIEKNIARKASHASVTSKPSNFRANYIIPTICTKRKNINEK